GLITIARGTGGITMNRPLSDITFYDVYQAVEPDAEGDLFRFHEAPNPNCPVGRNIHRLLDEKLRAIQESMEDKMREFTLADLQRSAQEILSEEN
ncbi:MAG: Rrf2 family transcriptional regulator, partial [Abditibacteriota bacterium]|nr:Rrf2 family transcriptional regulator [Abditibacteriota bacterium]